MENKTRQPDFIQQLLHLCRKIRQAASINELSFILCNNTKTFISFHQTFFWRQINQKIFIEGISGTAAIEHNAPMILWIKKLLQTQLPQDAQPQLHIIDKDKLPDFISQQWCEWLPTYALWSPLLSPSHHMIGGLLISRQQPWNERELKIIALISELASQRLYTFYKRKKPFLSHWSRAKKINVCVASIVAVIAILCIPVRQTILASSEIIAKDPYIVTSPLNGVLNKFYITPNDSVKANTPLFDFDKTEFTNNVHIAAKNYQLALEKYRKASQHAFNNPEGKAQLAILRIDAEKAHADLLINKEWLSRCNIATPIAGIVLFSDEDDWIGRPVKIGEKILEIANPKQKELEIFLPASNLIQFKLDTLVKFYPNNRPFHVISAQLDYTSYNATLQPNGIYAYKLKAKFTSSDNHLPRIGLRGTAKIYGAKVSLFYYLMRKPIASLRQFLGV